MPHNALGLQRVLKRTMLMSALLRGQGQVVEAGGHVVTAQMLRPRVRVGRLHATSSSNSRMTMLMMIFRARMMPVVASAGAYGVARSNS